MSKLMTTTALAVMMASAAPLAYAQTMTPAPTSPQTERTTTAPSGTAARDDFTTNGGDLRASEIIGSTVYDEQNQDIGSVKDVLLDHGGKVQSVVLDVGAFLGMGGKYVTVSLNDFKTDNNRLTLNKTKDQLQSAPEFHFGTR
jgi:sporulation protein YlmC with PRC-barrel domain